MYTKTTKFRASFLFFILIFFFVILLVRLFWLHLGYLSFSRLANKQYKFTLQLNPRRGTIYDRKGNRLALSLKVNSVYAIPSEIKDKLKVAQVLSPLLNLDKKRLIEKFSHNSFVWVKRKINSSEEKAIKKAALKGIYFLSEEKRFYPQGKLGAHILGFCDIDNKGLEGLELFYNDYLKGWGGWRLGQKDARNYEIASFKQKSIRVIHGYDLILTIDIVIQYIVEKELKKVIEKYKPLSATVIVLNPQNGEILALANYPNYNPNSFSSFSASFRRNRAVVDFFEPGSVFKIITASAALEEKIAEPKDVFYCEKGKYRFKGHVLHDYRPYGKLTFSEIIEKSSNIGISKIAQRLGKERLYKYILKFKFGSLTGVDLPGETKGLIRPLKKWREIAMINIPMGQGIAVSSLQLARAISVIANGGMLVQPHLIKEIKDSKGKKIKTFSFSRQRIIGEETASKMREILQKVVEKGTGKNARIKGYKVAGKTGTAQKPSLKGGYEKDKFVSSFIGFLPADMPSLCIVVVVDSPQGKHFSSIVAAPLFQKIGKQVMEYLK